MKDPAPASWLEHLTALVLLLVLAALGGIVLAAFVPGWDQWCALQDQVGIVLGLLTAALGLVSAVALRHTRT